MNTSNPARTKAARQGFALVTTLSLMILLTIVAVGLLSLSAVSLRVSSQGQSVAEARANARLALMMAIGELQRELGPDSRVSAPYDAGTTASGGKPRWTAVYDAWQRPAAGTPETPQSRIPKFRSWLASGVNQATGGPPGIGEEVQLVGPDSLGTGTKSEDEILVPMHAISSGNQRGRFAWWSSDESFKAKISAGAEGYPDTKPLFDAQSPPHIGHRAIKVLESFDWKPGQRSIAITNGAVNLAAELNDRGLGNLNHDITVHSAGVLADVRGGHLKRDLSNLLARPVEELENKPLYVADGRMNRFQIKEDGSLTNESWVTANAAGAGRWGINLEELHLFHQIHREVDWSSGKPRLVNKNSKEDMAQDRFFIYRKPVMEAQNVMLSFLAEAEAGTAPVTYRIVAMMDAMVATSNPNDIPIVWPANVLLRMKMEGFPYRPRWNIRRADNSVRHNHTVTPINRPFFQSAIRGGFTLEPGEAAVFGASTTDTQSRSVNLTRGYKPRGGVRINETEWGPSSNAANDGLRATGLRPDDIMDFSMIPAPTSNGATPSGWITCNAELRNSSGGTDTRMSRHRLSGGGGSVLTTAPINLYLPSPLRPTQRLNIKEFIGVPMPVIMVTTMLNVEKSRALAPPNAFPSRPYHLHEPAVSTMTVSTTTAENTDLTMHRSQLLAIGESMEYEFTNNRTMPAGLGGRNLYHGGSREVGLGGSFKVVKRRIPLAPPLSLGAFENAIACGFIDRISGGTALSGDANGLPAIAKAIGNSWSNPFLTSDVVFSSAYHDPSWMANTALWDSWFLSGIVDGGATGSSPWIKDSRSQRQQFRELAERRAALRNGRLIYHPHKSTEEALNELFDGEVLKPAAIHKLTKYLLVDGAFNVNSTSVAAWKAFLTSVRDQELLDETGAPQKKTHPFGTMGYAVTAATEGPEGDWNGFRDLSDSEMAALAEAIIEEVKARGPFLSMADFVNRRPDSSVPAHRAVGALQAAIDKSDLNDRFKGLGRDLTAGDMPDKPDGTPILAGEDTLSAEPTPVRSIGSAGLLSQGALLSALGSQITVRGDTFVVRTYGDSRDTTGKILAKAWCEAVVQRVPEYVDPVDSPEAHDGWPNTSNELAPANSRFGRRMVIRSFRWLNSVEI